VAEKIDFGKCNFWNFRGPWPWPWIGSNGIPSCITHRPLSTYQISLKSNKLFVDGRTDIRMYGHTYWWTDISPSNVIRSTRRSRPKDEVKCTILVFWVPFSASMQQAGQQEGIQPIIPQRLSLWKHTQCGVTLKYKTSYIRLNSEHSSGTVARVGIYLIMSCYLWSPYGIGQTIIFLSCVSSIFLFFPRLISAVADWMSAILPHMVWP